LIVVALAAIVAAVVVGLIANRRLRPRLLPDEQDSMSLSDVINQALTLAVVFLAFVLVGNSESYDRARQAAVAEAGVVDHVFELAEYAPEPQRRQIQGAMVCYARAVVAYEWPHMDLGRSKIASMWSIRVRDNFRSIERSDSLFQLIDEADQQRSLRPSGPHHLAPS